MLEATDPANEQAFVGRENPLVDFAEKARLDAEDAYLKKYDTPQRPLNKNGLIFRVKRRD